jgi:type IV pilus assembly protein PilV
MHLAMKNTNGFSMVELLVALLILAIGLIGLAGLQVAVLRSNQIAYYRSVATELAYDIADRMRANPVGVQQGNYNQWQGAQRGFDCQAVTCTPAQLAGFDSVRWNADLLAKLPGGIGMVCLFGNQVLGNSANPAATCGVNGEVYAIKIWWNDERTGATTQGFQTSFRP